MKKNYLKYLCLLSTIPFSISGILFLHEIKNSETSIYNKREINNKVELENRLALTIFSREHIVDVSDLNLNEQDVLDVWTSFQEKLHPIFPYLNLSTSQSVPPTFIQKEGNKVIQVNASYKDYDRDETKIKATEMANKFYSIIKYAPINNNMYNYPYYIYQRVVDWYKYNIKSNDSHYLFWGLTQNEGVCEVYSKLSLLLFNSLNINAAFISGNITTSNPGPHVWNQYEINGKWFNFDSTFGDGFASTSGDIKPTPANYQYLAFPNTFQSSSREYHNNWWKPIYNADVDMTPYINYVPYNNEIYKSRKYPYNDKWYFIKDNQIIKSNINYSNQESVYTFNDQSNKVEQLGLWSLGNKLFFIDIDNNKYNLKSYNLDNGSLEDIKQYEEEVIKMYINNSNEIVIETTTKTDRPSFNIEYDYLKNNSIQSIKSLAVINSLWFNSISLGRKTNELTNNNFIKYFNQLRTALEANQYSNELKSQMINFSQNVTNDLNKTDLPNISIQLNNSYLYKEYDNTNIEPIYSFDNSTEDQYKYTWQEFINNKWVDTKYTSKNLVIKNIDESYNEKKFRMKCEINNEFFYSNETILIINKISNINLELRQTNITPFNFVKGTTFNFNATSYILNNDNQKIDLSNKYKYDLYLNDKIVSTNNEESISYTLTEEDANNDIIKFYIKVTSFNGISNEITFNKTPYLSITYNGNNVSEGQTIELNSHVSKFNLEIIVIKRSEEVLTSFKYDSETFNLASSHNGNTYKYSFELKNKNPINTIINMINNGSVYATWKVELNNYNGDSTQRNKNSDWLIIIEIVIPIIVVLMILIIVLLIISKKKKKKN